MSVINRQLTSPQTAVLIAEGPQNVTINFHQGVGQFYIEDAIVPGATPDAPSVDIQGAYIGLEPQPMALAEDQALFVRGAGTLVVIATSPVIE